MYLYVYQRMPTSISANFILFLHCTQHLLIACFRIGSTSAGKSTFVNALLGQQLLPTSYNAATSVLCEVKYGDHKMAKVHFSSQTIHKTIEYDLTDPMQQRDLWRCISCSGVTKDGQTTACSKAEIFWPFEFLKVNIKQKLRYLFVCDDMYKIIYCMLELYCFTQGTVCMLNMLSEHYNANVTLSDSYL